MWTENGRAEILVGVDGSSASLHAVDWAVRLADEADRLTLCCVMPASTRSNSEQRDVARRIIAQARSRAERGSRSPTVAGIIVYGQPGFLLRQRATAMSLVVLGCPAATRAHHTIAESLSAHLLADMPCSVVMARPTAHAAGPVVVGIDDSAGAQAAMDLGFQLAKRHHTELCAVHASLTADAEEFVGRMVDPWTEKYRTVSVRRRVRYGSAAEVLIRESRMASAVVVGASSTGGTPTLARDVIARAGCTVAIAR